MSPLDMNSASALVASILQKQTDAKCVPVPVPVTIPADAFSDLLKSNNLAAKVVNYLSRFHTFPEKCAYMLESVGYNIENENVIHACNLTYESHLKETSQQRVCVYSDTFHKRPYKISAWLESVWEDLNVLTDLGFRVVFWTKVNCDEPKYNTRFGMIDTWEYAKPTNGKKTFWGRELEIVGHNMVHRTCDRDEHSGKILSPPLCENIEFCEEEELIRRFAEYVDEVYLFLVNPHVADSTVCEPPEEEEW